MRGKGLGSQVVDALVEEARAAGVSSLGAVTHEDNEASRRLFVARGFAFLGESTKEWTEASEETWVEFRRELR